MMTILLFSALTLSTMFMFLNHPLSFGLILLMETFFISIITGMMNYNYWFSYIIFLIMVGGMLILFIYMTSVASNEKFKFSYKLFIMMASCMILSFSLIFTDFFLTSMNFSNQDNVQFLANNSLSMTKFINFPSNSIMVMIIVYLLITLIMTVKITNIQYGPLRQKF
uniref:NADH-ubiquinone oxidoreductase chain 6 n=1 Tax=Coleoptera sp. 16 KM-2017 TaxID=2219319 RepID=A0A346RH71_9COLE|nr:NADH dehydrogenase subunit 6 [Coleoptera sp. 16 KM-2017]